MVMGKKLRSRTGGGYNNRFLASGRGAKERRGFSARRGKVDSALRVASVGLFSFLATFMVVSMFAPAGKGSAIECDSGTVSDSAGAVCGTDNAEVNVSVEGAWAISVSSAGTLGTDLTPTSSGTLSTVVDNLNIYANTPGGYQLYLNATSGSTDIYNSNILDENGTLDTNLPSGTNTNHFTSTTGTKASPATLSGNTWGYSLASSPTTFSKVETSNDNVDSNIYTSSTKTPGEGDDIDVTYGFMADTGLAPGTYNTQVTYTTVAEMPAYGIQAVSPSTINLDQEDVELTIITTTPATELGLGEVSAKIVSSTNGTSARLNAPRRAASASNLDVPLTDCTATTAEVAGTSYHAATCTYHGGTVAEGGLPVGSYTIQLTSSWHNATYVKASLLNVVSSYNITSISPNAWLQFNNGSKDITIATDIPAAGSEPGEVTAKLINSTNSNTTVELVNCTSATANGFYAITCTYPGNAALATYNLEMYLSNQNATYAKASAITISAESYSITSVSPTTGNNNATTVITMVTNALTSSSTAFGTVTGKIGTTNLSDCSATTSGNYRAVQCTIPSGVTAGTYTVQFTAAGHSSTTYSKASAVTIKAYLTVSGGSGSGWYAPNTTVNIAASACATNYRFNNWTTTGGTLGSSTSSSTTIKTTTSNITVTRNCIINPYLTVSGGTGSGYYAPNSTINISASACSSGYTFNNWTTTGGTLGNANASSTTIKIASANVTVTRNCKVNNISGISQMQQMTSAICSATSSGTSKTLTDTRDNNSYRITKLPDGYCWMTQNMKYATSGSVANKSGYDGRLYTWSQANSTCPSGWVLPPNSGARSYQNLFSGRVTSYSGAEASPYYFTRAGYYSGSSYSNQGSSGYYWSSTAKDSSGAYVFRYSTSYFNPQGYVNKTNYLSVRCVFGS